MLEFYGKNSFEKEVKELLKSNKQFNKNEKKEIANKLQNGILQLIDTGELPSLDVALMYRYIKDINVEKNKKVEKLINILLKAIKDIEFESDEYFITNYVIMVLGVVNNDIDTIKQALKNYFITDIHGNYTKRNEKFLKEFFYNLDIETYLQINIELLRDYFEFTPQQRRNIYNYILFIGWLHELYINSPKWVKLYEVVKNNLYTHIKRDEIDEVLFVQFFLYHIMGNSFSTIDEWRVFNKEIIKPASIYYKNWGEKHNLKKPPKKYKHKKKKIGFVRERLVENSPFKVEYSLLKTLMENEEFKENYEIIYYSLSYVEKSDESDLCIKKLTDIGVKYKNVIEDIILKKDLTLHI